MKIAVASGKGGTGKTTLSVNLAKLMAENNKQKIFLTDLDVEEPNTGIFLKSKLIEKRNVFRMVPEWNKDLCIFCGTCKKVCNYHAIAELPNQILVFQELCHSCYACSELCSEKALPMKKINMGIIKHFHEDNFHHIESTLNIGEPSAVPLIKKTKEYVLKQAGDESVFLFDAPPGTSCPMIESVKEMDFVILVSEPTPFGLNDLKLAVETIRMMNISFAVVINRYGTGDDKTEKYCQKERIKILGKLPYRKDAAVLYSNGKMLIDDIPEIRQEIQSIANQLMSLK